MIAESIRLSNFPNLYARLWSPHTASPRGVVHLIHGLGDHGERYRSFSQHLIRENWAVLAVDLPGHGKSHGKRGSVKNYNTLLRIITACRGLSAERFPAAKQVLLGHSMGGNLVFNFALRHGEFEPARKIDLSAVILIAPMLMPPQVLNRTQILAAWATGRMFPWLRISKQPRIDQLTGDALAAERIGRDPARHGDVSLYLATQLLAQGRFALDNAGRVSVPTMILQGSEDELVDQSAARHLAIRAGDQAQFMNWPGGRHDLLHCRDADRVAEHIIDWMNRISDLTTEESSAATILRFPGSGPFNASKQGHVSKPVTIRRAAA